MTTGLGAVGVVLLLITLIAAVPVGILFLQLVAAALRGVPQEEPSDARSSDDRLTVLMPAHDEASGITAAIAAVRSQLGPHDRLLVVADNCTDQTAAIARAAGADVSERVNLQRRGKGYALDHGVRWLEQEGEPPAVVVIVDADCIVAPQALDRLARRCLSAGRPVQALYLMHAPPGSAIGLRVAEFAWLIKNKLRPLGSAAWGAPCQLMGTGMAFPWAVISKAPLASGHLVEDMELGLELAAAGQAPIFCPQALVSSAFPNDVAGARAQRTRWEHGHLGVIASVGPRLLTRALLRGDATLAAMVLDLMVPPLAALVLTLVALLGIDLAWWWATGDARAAAAVLTALVLLVLGVISAWWRDGRAIVSWRELLGLPLYVAGKIPVYVRLFTNRQIEWVRTKRDDQGH